MSRKQKRIALGIAAATIGVTSLLLIPTIKDGFTQEALVVGIKVCTVFGFIGVFYGCGLFIGYLILGD